MDVFKTMDLDKINREKVLTDQEPDPGALERWITF